VDWQAYYLAALEELETVRSSTMDQDIRDFIHAKLSDVILITLAQCYDSNGQVEALAALTKRCKERVMGKSPMTQDRPHDPLETQTTIGEWANQTFGGSGDPLSPRHCIRLLEEVVELWLAAGASQSDVSVAVARELGDPEAPSPEELEYLSNRKFGISNPELVAWYESHPNLAKVPEEMADCEIVLRVLAHRRDIDLQSEVDKKMKINRYRRWKLNNDGTGYHVKEGEK